MQFNARTDVHPMGYRIGSNPQNPNNRYRADPHGQFGEAEFVRRIRPVSYGCL